VPKGESIAWPGAKCPKCGDAIRWYDNVAVVSWLAVRGRCRDCGEPISPRYPMVELLVALLAVGALHRFGPRPAAAAFFAFAAVMVALAYIDLDTWLVPHAISVPALVAGLAFAPVNPELGRWWLAPL